MEALRKIMQPEIDAAAQEAARRSRIEGLMEGERKMLISLVKDGLITVTVASDRLGISEAEFQSYLN